MIKPKLGLKGSTDDAQLLDRLQYHPDTYEFYLTQQDVSSQGLVHLTQQIQRVQAAGVPNIVLHHPMKYNGEANELVVSQTQDPKLYAFMQQSSTDLIQLAQKMGIQVLIHGSYFQQTPHFISAYPSFKAAQTELFNRLDAYAKLGGQHVMFENSISNLFGYGDALFDQKVLEHGYRLAFDTSHCFIKARGDNATLLASLKRLQPAIVHYHLVDSMGQTHDSLPLGRGQINWEQVLPLLNPTATSIYEINLANQKNCQEMLSSHRFLQKVADKV